MKRNRENFILFLIFCLAIVIAFILSCAVSAHAETHCGKERWPIKILADDTASLINFDVQDTTVAEAITFPAPAKRDLRDNSRITPYETQVWRIHVLVMGWKWEADGDYHIVVADPKDTHKTFIAEIPDVSCVSDNAELYQKLRLQMVKLGRPHGHGKMVWFDQPVPATVVGVGFFDFLHGQTGVAPNGFELHPLLSVETE